MTWQRPVMKHREVVEPYGYRVWHPEYLYMEKDIDIGTGTVIHAHAGVFIGNNVKIGPHCTILSKSDIGKDEWPRFSPVKILDNTQIGAYSLIMPGSTASGLIKAYTYFDNGKKKPD